MLCLTCITSKLKKARPVPVLTIVVWSGVIILLKLSETLCRELSEMSFTLINISDCICHLFQILKHV